MLLCAHNGSKYIHEQIQSILCQTFKVDSLLVFDFGSTDGTNDLLLLNYTEYKRLGCSIHYIFVDTAGGVNTSFQFALSHISTQIRPGDLIFFSDQDDVWLPFKIERIVEEYDRLEFVREPIILHHNVVVVDEKLNVLKRKYYSGAQAFLLREQCEHRGIFNTVIGHTIMMNSESVLYLEKFVLNNDFLMYDWFWAFAVERRGSVVYVDQVLSNYRQHQDNQIGIRGLTGGGLRRILSFVDYVRQVENNFNMMSVSITNHERYKEVYVGSYQLGRLFFIVFKSFSLRLILIYSLFLFYRFLRKVRFVRRHS